MRCADVPSAHSFRVSRVWGHARAGGSGGGGFTLRWARYARTNASSAAELWFVRVSSELKKLVLGTTLEGTLIKLLNTVPLELALVSSSAEGPSDIFPCRGPAAQWRALGVRAPAGDALISSLNLDPQPRPSSTHVHAYVLVTRWNW